MTKTVTTGMSKSFYSYAFARIFAGFYSFAENHDAARM